jgi:hypothetical protein
MGFFRNHHTVQSIALLMIAIVSVQASASLAKILFASFPVLSISALRLFLGFALIAVFFQIWRVAWQQIRWSSILGYGLALAGMNALFYLSLSRLPLGIAVSFEFIGPLSVALLHAKHRYDLIWVGLAIVGLLLLFPWNQTQQALDPVGIFLAIGAVLGHLYFNRQSSFRNFRQSYRVFRHVDRLLCVAPDSTMDWNTNQSLRTALSTVFYWLGFPRQRFAFFFRNGGIAPFKSIAIWYADQFRTRFCSTLWRAVFIGAFTLDTVVRTRYHYDCLNWLYIYYSTRQTEDRATTQLSQAKPSIKKVAISATFSKPAKYLDSDQHF